MTREEKSVIFLATFGPLQFYCIFLLGISSKLYKPDMYVLNVPYINILNKTCSYLVHLLATRFESASKVFSSSKWCITIWY